MDFAEFKEKLKYLIPFCSLLLGIIFVVSSVIAFSNGRLNYKKQLEQSDWEITNATVSYVQEDFDYSHGSSRTYYDIHYDYVVDDQIYSGIIQDRSLPEDIGKSFEIKYDPQSPEESTHILEPSKSFITSGTVFGILAIVLITSSLLWYKKHCKKEK